MTLDEQLEILNAAKRGEKIEVRWKGHVEVNACWKMIEHWPHDFDFGNKEYRIADPYAELKAAAKDPTKEVWIRGTNFIAKPDWTLPPESYEIRDKPKAKKVVKYLCWELPTHQLAWLRDDQQKFVNEHLVRRPAFDKECEVDDE